ncbi:MAG TPA: hypothetical protein DDY84_02805 [Ruminococcus sp.]|nr:hypothetical protein [Ruminococcus sp.]
MEQNNKQKTGNKKEHSKECSFFAPILKGGSKNETISEPNPDCGFFLTRVVAGRTKRKKEGNLHEKMETDPVCNSGGFAVVRKYACMGGRDSGS